MKGVLLWMSTFGDNDGGNFVMEMDVYLSIVCIFLVIHTSFKGYYIGDCVC